MLFCCLMWYRSLFEIECTIKNLLHHVEYTTTHHGKRAIKYDLNFSSLPWILGVHLKPGKHCARISDLELELQLVNVIFYSLLSFGEMEKHILLVFQ